MIRACFPCVALVIVGAAAAPAAAQEQSAPKVVTMTTDATELLNDIRYSMSLASPAEQAQWPNLLKYLDVFLIGLDRAKPARMDIIYGGEFRRYRTSLPVENLKKFRDENLDTLGITSQRKSSFTYKLSDAFEGWMRVFPNNFASIAKYQEDVPAEYTPLKGIEHLLHRNYDAAVEGTNIPDGMEDRRRMYQRDRQEWMAKLQRDKNETDDDYALRRLLYEHQLDEAERIFVEGKHLLIGGTVNASKGEIRFDIEMTPLAETSLARNIDAIGKQPSQFAGVPKVKDPIISGRITMPLDEQRQENLLELTELLRTRYKNIVNDRKTSTAAQKDAARKAVDLFFDMVDTGTKGGLLDGFMEGHPSGSGKNTVVGGLETTDGNAFIDILKLLPDINKDHRVEFDVAEAEGVKIHRATWPVEYRKDLQGFFGEDSYYVGTAKESIWFGAGPGALDELKAAIADAGNPGDAKPGPFIDVLMRLGPWTELLHKRMGNTGRADMRERAIEAFRPGDDQFTLVLDKRDGHVAGEMIGNTGILRFVGKMFAEFTRNIDEQ